ncbi:MAG: DUF192 domain-containing protein [Firmicutes bacterium]|jgi:uncharacterized membrane protein (UPF0127 family)|nr:DUF192 domain-containing protein [Bacillota bacterium]
MSLLYLEKDGRRLANIIPARTFLQRLRGLMFTKKMPAGKALMLTPCRGVHTFFMRYPVDILFLDHDFKVLEVCPALKPNRFSPIIKKACHVLEFSPGTIYRLGIRPGDRLEINGR